MKEWKVWTVFGVVMLSVLLFTTFLQIRAQAYEQPKLTLVASRYQSLSPILSLEIYCFGNRLIIVTSGQQGSGRLFTEKDAEACR